jgi:hypothetical protein
MAHIAWTPSASGKPGSAFEIDPGSLAEEARYDSLSNWNSKAVLDRETGLVWERTPISTTSGGTRQGADCGPSRSDPRNREVRSLSVTRASRRIWMPMPIRDPAGIRRGTGKVGNFGGPSGSTACNANF